MRILVTLLLIMLLPCFAMAQNSKKVKALQRQKSELQNNLKQSQSELSKTKQRVKASLQNLSFLTQQMDSRLEYIIRLEKEMNQLDAQIVDLQAEILVSEGELQTKREKLKQAMRYARAQRNQVTPLLFILSAKTFTQMYRRARYAREYVAFQRNLGEQILVKQAELLEGQNLLLESKSQKNELMREVMTQRRSLGAQQVQQQRNVAGLKKQESGLAGKVALQQKQLAELDKKIDQLIAYEIEQARKAAEEAARKKAAAAAAKNGKGSTSSSKTSSSKASPAKPETWLTPEERQLNGTFEQNKGRLPVPITGQYMIGNRFGKYNVPGLNNVQLDNKGTNYVGRPGARARAIFGGVVTAVFQFGGTRNVLVRHGSYISVYCNLSSVTVTKGQKVNARDILGTVSDDGDGNCVLHFQLRKETAKLNPESWIGR